MKSNAASSARVRFNSEENLEMNFLMIFEFEYVRSLCTKCSVPDTYNSYWKVKKRSAMIRNWYNQTPRPALKTKREITKYINWQQFTKGTRGKPNEQLFLKQVV